MADAKQVKTPMEDYCNGSSQSRVVLAKPRLGGFGSSSFASSSNKSNPFGSVLRPPQLKPTSNPFLKVTDNLNTSTDKAKEEEKKDVDEVKVSEDRLKETKEEPEAPKFIPLGSANVTPRTNNQPAAVQPTSSAGFVFGQNLSERVVLKEQVNNGDAECTVDHSSSNGASELLFSNAVASAKDSNQEEAGPSEGSSESSLAAAAAEYERSHARPPPPTTNYTTTGEEGETNVLQISCRLFAWEAGSWRERGRGVLRLNDAAGDGGARLVARVAGSLRVVLNTKLWPAMVAQRAGAKSLRVTAADANCQIKLYLIMGAPCDINLLYKALTARISVNKPLNEGPSKENSTSQQAAERLEAAADDIEYLDKGNEDLYGREGQDTPPIVDQDSLDGPEQTENTDDNAPSEAQKPNAETEETVSLKRKEPADDDTPPKRQCPRIVID